MRHVDQARNARCSGASARAELANRASRGPHALLFGSAFVLGCAGSAPVRTNNSAASALFQPFSCAERVGDAHEAAQLQRSGEAMHLATPASYLLVRRRTSAGPASLAERGAPCSDAGPAQADCRDQLAQLDAKLQAAGCSESSCLGAYAITESQGVAVGHATPSELARLLQPIDSPEEAWLLAQAGSEMPGPLCGDPEQSAFRPVESGYELRYRYLHRACDAQAPEVAELVVHVGSDARVRELRRALLSSPPKPCVEVDPGSR